MRKFIIFLLTILACHVFSQNGYTVEQAIADALKNNEGIKAARLMEQQQQKLKRTAFDLPKTNLMLMTGQYNSYSSDKNFTVTQSIPFTAFGSQRKLLNAQAEASSLQRVGSENELVFQVKQTYQQLLYMMALYKLRQQQDSLYDGFMKAAIARHRAGEATLLEKTTSEMQRQQSSIMLQQSEADIETWLMQLISLTRTPEPIKLNETMIPLSWDGNTDTVRIFQNPSTKLAQQQIQVANALKKVETSKLAPELVLGYFNQSLIGTINPDNLNKATSSKRFTGLQVGLALPIFFNAQQARVKAATFGEMAERSAYANHKNVLNAQWQSAVRQYQKNESTLNYYQTSASVNASLILKQSSAAFAKGEIDYSAYLSGLQRANSIRESSLQSLHDFNQSIIYLQYLSAEK